MYDAFSMPILFYDNIISSIYLILYLVWLFSLH
jgi:hypothetical protein